MHYLLNSETELTPHTDLSKKLDQLMFIHNFTSLSLSGHDIYFVTLGISFKV